MSMDELNAAARSSTLSRTPLVTRVSRKSLFAALGAAAAAELADDEDAMLACASTALPPPGRRRSVTKSAHHGEWSLAHVCV
jgi:hypothetical protein